MKRAKCILKFEIDGKTETIEAAIKALEVMKELHPGIDFQMELRERRKKCSTEDSSKWTPRR